MGLYRLCVIVLSIAVLLSCENSRTQVASFNQWLLAQPKGDCELEKKSQLFTSEPLYINGIAPSMSGDLSSDVIKLGERDKLVWLTGCNLELIDSETRQNLDQEFLCHHIVNYNQPQELPWKIPTQGTDKRLFTLTQGFLNMTLPEGFGIPFQGGGKIDIGNQVLNLNDPNLERGVEFKVELNYLEGNCSGGLKALYQQPIMITKKVSGPKGGFNQVDTVFHDSLPNMDTAFAQCGIRYENGFNPYADPYGRRYTGHWTVSTDSIEILKTNVTPMMDLNYDTRIHYIATHVHPHAQSLELVDKTTGESLYKATIENVSGRKKGVKSISYYSSVDGIPVYQDHEYQLISVYTNPNGDSNLTAMATMFLYLAEH